MVPWDDDFERRGEGAEGGDGGGVFGGVAVRGEVAAVDGDVGGGEGSAVAGRGEGEGGLAGGEGEGGGGGRVAVGVGEDEEAGFYAWHAAGLVWW